MRINFKKKIVILFGLTISALSINAQGIITIDHKTQRFVDNVSTFDRSKYTNVHFGLRNNTDAPFRAFKSQYKIKSDYLGSRQFYNPFSKVKNGVIPNVRSIHKGKRSVNRIIATGKATNLFYNNKLDYSKANVSGFSLKVAKYVAESFKKEWGDVSIPEFIEPFNEPMVHAIDYYPEGRATPPRYIGSKIDNIITKICAYHRDLGKSIHAVPELSNMKVMGYASAFPEFEAGDFSNWNTRYKKFMDIAGADMDLFSIHLYDGSGINNSGGRRSGSNSEAILDLLETYSYKKFGVVKPIAITEYGRLVENQPNFLKGGANYNAVVNSQAVRSQIHMAMNFIERANKIEMAIPFSVNERDSKQTFSKATLFTKNASGNVVLTPRKYFYEVLKDLKGRRVRINSTNIDVQTQAFVDGNKLYVVLNNLNDREQLVNLKLLNNKGLKNVVVKRLKIFTNKVPLLTTKFHSKALDNLSLVYGETAVLTYTFDKTITFGNKIYSKKYYSSDYLKPIKSNGNNWFAFKNVDVGSGFATLRVSVGRNLGASLKPTIYVNGKKLTISGDLIRGYNQNTRKRFFGTLEIPVKMDVLRKGNNTVNVKFSDNGGHISSVILQVQKFANVNPIVNPGGSNAFFVVNRKTGKKLRPQSGDDGAKLIQVDAGAVGTLVQWKQVNTSGGYFYLQNVATGKYFRPVSGNVNSLLEQQPTKFSGYFTQWRKVNTSGGHFYLQNRETKHYFRPQRDANNSPIVQQPTSSKGNYTQWKFVTVSAKVLTNEEKIKINTNPIVNGIISLSNAKNTSYSISNITGQKVQSGSVDNNTIDVGSLNAGIYIIEFANGNSTQVEKIVIQ